MRLRGVLLVLVAFSAVMMTPAKAQWTTPTESLALREAAMNHTAYTLSPEKLKQAEELFRTRTTLHFLGEGWAILQLVLLLALGVPVRMRNVAERTGGGSVLCLCFFFCLRLRCWTFR
jgi:STE24 endopeptidase